MHQLFNSTEFFNLSSMAYCIVEIISFLPSLNMFCVISINFEFLEVGYLSPTKIQIFFYTD